MPSVAIDPRPELSPGLDSLNQLYVHFGINAVFSNKKAR